MTVAQVRCAAQLVYRDEHRAVGRWWTIASPDGDLVTLCSAACALSWLIWGPLPAEGDELRGRSAQEAA
jgi:hypothetical protein